MYPDLHLTGHRLFNVEVTQKCLRISFMHRQQLECISFFLLSVVHLLLLLSRKMHAYTNQEYRHMAFKEVLEMLTFTDKLVH